MSCVARTLAMTLFVTGQLGWTLVSCRAVGFGRRFEFAYFETALDCLFQGSFWKLRVWM